MLAVRVSIMPMDEANRPPFGRVVDVLLDPEKISSPEYRKRWLAETAELAFASLLDMHKLGRSGEVKCAD